MAAKPSDLPEPGISAGQDVSGSLIAGRDAIQHIHHHVGTDDLASLSKPQPLLVALDELKDLLMEGENKVSLIETQGVPASDEIEDYWLRTEKAVKRNVFAKQIQTKEWATFQEQWDAYELLRRKAELGDAGVADFALFGETDSEASKRFDRLYGRVERLRQLIAVIEGCGQ